MKVLHITSSSKGGAGIAALRLHEALQQQGIQSGYLSANLTVDFNNKPIKDNFFTYKKPTLFKRALLKIQSHFAFTKEQRLHNQFNNIKDKLNYEIANLPFSVYKLHEHPLVQEADIINLHWMNGLIDYTVFFKECQKPIVWTLHDMNPFMGIFHYKNDEVKNSQIAGNFDNKIKEIKAKAIKSVKNGTIVAPSKWLLEEAIKSNVFDGFSAQHICNGISFESFKYDKKILRKNNNIEVDEFIVLFVSDNLKNYRKGFDLLVEVLSSIDDLSITLFIIGKGTFEPQNNLKIIALGEVNSISKMAEYYNLANVFVLPSREDNLPNVMLEAFASGTPLVGFKIGGIAEHTINGVTGFLAEEMTVVSLAEAIKKIYQKKTSFDEEIIRNYAEDNFSYKKQADSYLSVYNKSLNKIQ